MTGKPGARTRILLVEDDDTLRRALTGPIERADYRLISVADGAAAIRELSSNPYEVVLLDIGLPLIDGWEVLAKLEANRLPAVIMISARGSEQDKVRALDMGADDYMAKPFGTDELLSRIGAVLRRARATTVEHRVVQHRGVTVDLSRRVVLRMGEEVRLSPTEYLLVAALARRQGTVVDHRTLLQEVWGSEFANEWNYLRVFAGRLRGKLEEDPAHPQVIISVPGRGYRFGPPQLVI